MPETASPQPDHAPTKGDKKAAPPKPATTKPDDDVVGKAYDGRIMRRLAGYLAPYKLQTGVSAAAILLKAFTDIAGPFLLAVTIDTYLAPEAGKQHWLTHFLSRTPLTGVTEIALLYLAALSITFGLEFVQTYLMQWTGQKIMFDLRSQIFRHIQRMHIAFFDRNPVGRLVTRVTSDVDALNDMFTSGVLAIFEDICSLSFIIVVMLSMSWPLALLTISVIPGIAYATHLFRKHVRDSYRRQRAATAKINSFTQEYVSGMSVVQLFNREKRAFRDFSAVNLENKEAWTDAIFAYALYYPVVEFLASIAIALVIWRGGIAVLGATQHTWLSHHLYVTASGASAYSLFGNIVTLGTLIAFIRYAQRFFYPIQDLSDKFNILQAAMAAAERIFKLIDTVPDIPAPAKIIPGDHSGRIEFRNVWFTYQQLTTDQEAALQQIRRENASSQIRHSERSAAESKNPEAAHLTSTAQTLSTSNPNTQQPTTNNSPADHPLLRDIEWILRGVSFTIEPDHTAAIVGHTGAGKTTITALMMRFYDVQSGTVLVDGVDVREQDVHALRLRFGIVLQDSFLFTGTIAKNIRLGTESITDEQVERAAEEVNVADYIRSLPEGFNTPVIERGATLSTGQKQLISFARALAHRPGILILDEATSSVDTETELRVESALARMITGRTSVLIAHRLSTVQRADTILVMHKGQLREQGSHQQLLAHRGLYYKLYQLQYKDQELAALTATGSPATA
ncbi:ABC transporter ATP-binding protein [Bryocella elongata]|nr:ABC transporter ATP-binding protein [Bryocella elongata]